MGLGGGFETFEFSAGGDQPETGLAESRALSRDLLLQTGHDAVDADQFNERAISLEGDLRAAVADGLLELHYQPQLGLDSGRLTGVEALARWNHPRRGAVSPEIFIRIAEDSDLILSLGSWALRTACRQLKQWDRAGITVPRVAVNVSSRQFVGADFVGLVGQVLAWLLLVTAMPRLPASLGGLLLLLQPALAFVIDVLAFHRPTGATDWFGLLLTLAGILAGTLRPRRAA